MRRMYSLAQIQAIVALMASKGELDFSDVDLAVKKLKVEEAEYTFDLTPDNLGDRVWTNRYSKAFVSGGVMYIIVSGVISNPTEGAISAGTIRMILSNIPKEIGDKIICFNGDPVSGTEGSLPQICSFATHRGNTLSSETNGYIFRNAQNSMSITIGVGNLNAGADEQVEGRQFISLF